MENIDELVRRLVDAWNAHDPDRVAALYAPGYQGLDIAERALQDGPDAVRRAVLRYVHAFPDLQLTLDEVIVGGDRAAVAWTARGTHRGTFMNIPPAGHEVEVRGVNVLAFEGDKVRQSLCVWDVAGMLRAIGLLPELAA